MKIISRVCYGEFKYGDIYRTLRRSVSFFVFVCLKKPRPEGLETGSLPRPAETLLKIPVSEEACVDTVQLDSLL
jgi:hypothetical protein